MAGVSEAITREYFELHEFLVRQPRKHLDQARRDEDDDIDFFVLNPHPRREVREDLPFVLSSDNLPFIERAVVNIKAWHTKTFSSAELAAAPKIFDFVESRLFQQAARAFGKVGMPLRIMVVPALPHDAEGREQAGQWHFPQLRLQP